MMNKTISFFYTCLLSFNICFSQNSDNRIKIEGIAAVIGNHVILESDIQKTLLDLKNRNISTENITRCEILEQLMKDKLYAFHAVQDSIEIDDANIYSYVEQQIESILQRMDNDINKLLEFYKKKSKESLKKELFNFNKINQLSQKMKNTITENIEVTPEEVRTFFKNIKKENLPLFGTEIEISQIVIEPEISKEEEDKVIDKLLKFKEDIEEKGMSFASKALLYSQDPGSRSRGGRYTITKKSPMVKEFKDIAFRLQEGEISSPFKTEFGWHIVKIDEIRGSELNLRHILLIPKTTKEQLEEARTQINKIIQSIRDNEISFEDAAEQFSTDKESKYNQGKLINPATLGTKFELTKVDPNLYQQIYNLKENEISVPFLEQDLVGKSYYKIFKISNRFEEHIASFKQDYVKIKALALKQKQLKSLKKWTKGKIQDTYISIHKDNKICVFENDWITSF